MALLDRARSTGVCPPSLLTDNRVPPGDGFDGAVTKILGYQGLSLALDRDVTSDFQIVMKMTELGTSGVMKEVLEYRRCIVIAVVGSSPVESAAVKAVLNSGYLNHVKTWYDQILQNKVGGIDLLLHLLTNIKDLPVTKSLVKQSGMGKAIGSIEKHSICAGSPNQAAIMDRVQQIKSAWNKSVKARKEKDGKPDKPAPIPKRQIQMPGMSTAAPPAKKARVEEKKPSSSKAFSSLLKKVSAGSTPEKSGAKLTNASSKSPTKSNSGDTPRSKKSNKRVKWADHFGGDLTKSRLLDSLDAPAQSAKADDGSVSWTDRKKRDRLKEKELLAKVKRAKLIDEDEDDLEPVRSRMTATREWRQPALLPDNPEVTKPQLSSKEIAVQTDRMTKVKRARYHSEDSVPNSPAPLSDVEQALDMTSVSSAVVATIPFFVPQVSAPAPAVVAPAPAPSYAAPVPAPPSAPPAAAYAPPPQSAHEAATAQTVQSLGLPMFLVGQNVQALQTLASSPSLLSTLVEPNGMYDQPRLMSLVQTLSQSVAAPQQSTSSGQIVGLPGYQPPAPPAPSYGSQGYTPSGGTAGGIYGPASGSAQSSSSGSSSFGGGFAGGPRGDRFRGDSNSEGNLHVSGYGPTTSQADLIGLFAPYVKVDEVVMKGTFAFVNTSDPMAAKQAKEALNGTLLGGLPMRINLAQRRSRDPNFGGGFGGGGGGGVPPPPRGGAPQGMNPPFGQNKPPSFGQEQNVNDVRDDRGNPATKNLFVAGYGPGTSEQQLRDVFGQYATIIGVITKGTFSFVNTSDKGSAIRCREALSSTVLNGGVLRINFAKETGRLGTSFDLTYNPGTSGGGSHYGRGY